MEKGPPRLADAAAHQVGIDDDALALSTPGWTGLFLAEQGDRLGVRANN